MLDQRVVLGVGFASGLAVALVFGAEGCLACDDSVCSSRLVVGVTEPDGAALSPGRWEFELVADSEAPLLAVCEVGEDSRSAHCDPGDLAIWPMILHDPHNPFTRFQIDFEGGDGLGGLPSTLDVKIVHEGGIVVEETHDPDYSLAEPERCDPDCFSDSISITVQRP